MITVNDYLCENNWFGVDMGDYLPIFALRIKMTYLTTDTSTGKGSW